LRRCSGMRWPMPSRGMAPNACCAAAWPKR
jgi:hypothetical protein